MKQADQEQEPDQGRVAEVKLSPSACMRTEQGAREFFDRFVGSADVRRTHTDLAAFQQRGSAGRFEIANVDNLWVYADPALDPGEYPRLALDLAFDDLGFQVEYTRARFSPDEESEELYGSTGRYRFGYKRGCWRLVEAVPIANAIPTKSTVAEDPAPAVEADGRLDERGRLSLTLQGIQIDLEAAACSQFTPAIQTCDTVAFAIASRDVAKQSIALDTLYINSDGTLFQGAMQARSRTKNQSIVLADVNADGRADLMLWTGQQGGYGGASYSVYLFEPTRKRYVHSDAFSALSAGRAGLFEIVDGQIRTGFKSGCCVHTTETYSLRGGVLVLVETVQQDATGSPERPKMTVHRRVDGKMTEVID